jgi:hypothetical protein
MNLTVGPLPPSVYWRRRAIVLGALLLVVLLLTYTCSGPNKSDVSGQKNTGSTQPIGLSSGPVSPAMTGASTPAGEFPPSTPASAPPLPSASPTPTTVGGIPICTDKQIKVTPVIASTSPTTTKLVHGGTFDLKLKIRNISTTTCRRDVGSVPEELKVTKGSTTIWSSDACPKGKGKTHDVRTFGPDIEIYADVKWSSYNILNGGCSKAAYPAAADKYALTGRVGTKMATVPFTIVP